MTFQAEVMKKIEDILNNNNISEQEKDVLREICMGPVRQRDIAYRVALWKHEVHEEHIQTGETTLRKVRQVIRDLRIKYGAPILSDRRGYWIPTTKEEVELYLTKMEREAQAQAKSWMITYNTMKKNFNVQSNFFDLWQPNE